MMHPKHIHTLEDAQRHVEGIINDFDEGLLTKKETIKHLFYYTIKMMSLAVDASKKQRNGKV